MKIPHFLVVVAMLASGCLSQESQHPQLTTAPTSSQLVIQNSTESSAEQNFVIQNSTITKFSSGANSLDLTDCRGMGTQAQIPLGVRIGEPPANWPRDNWVYTQIFNVMYECNRIHWGPFERGPIHMLLEGHDDFKAPADCKTGKYDALEAVGPWLIDDQEVVDWAKSTLNAPIQYADFNVTHSLENGRNTTTWTWNPQNGTASTLSTWDIPQDYYQYPYIERYVWTNGSTLYLLDLNQQWVGNNYGQSATGMLNRPMLYSETGLNKFVGRGAPFAKATAQGHLRHFGDFECKKQL